jgi:acyl dehydratase
VTAAFDDVRAGQEIPVLAKEVRREDVLAYAEASTDRNPLHLDDGFAREAGFPGMIAHGMFTMAHLTTCLTNWVGNPSALRSMKVLFRSAVQMGDVIEAGGTVASMDPETRTAALDVWVKVRRPDGTEEYAIRRSRAVVALA